MTALFDQPLRAAVRPRVTVAGGTVPRLLEEEVAELLAKGERVKVQLVGPTGSGRTTALLHLAATFAPDGRLGLRDADGKGREGKLVTVTASERPDEHRLHYFLEPWSDDDVLEYLLHVQRDCAARVFAAWQHDDCRRGLGRWPGICRSALDLLVQGQAGDVFAALRAMVERELHGHQRELVQFLSFLQCAVDEPQRRDVRERLLSRLLMPIPATNLRSLPIVRALLAAEYIVKQTGDGKEVVSSKRHWPAELVTAVRRVVLDTEGCEARLADQCRQNGENVASVMSVLCATHPGFRPPLAEIAKLDFAHLAAANLAQLRLHSINGANLHVADLRGANLCGASATGSRLAGACLDEANLEKAIAMHADGSGMLARNANFDAANFADSDLSYAVLDGSRFRGAQLVRACLDGASLRGADLTGAALYDSRFLGTDLGDASCVLCNFTGADLKQARLDGVVFDDAKLDRVDLSGTELPGLRAANATLRGAWLTDTRWPNARLRGAKFVEARLAAVDWEGADLRDCDFMNAVFHLGSSRSGLVGSPIAGEGSRTGFYTDESLEQAFQAPEDVRKANLRGCDLRGAKVEECDFYLVDLRGARLDALQVQWLRRCRAILDRDAEA